MARPVTDIPNLGPASAEAFARAGITTAEEIIALGPDEAYLRLLRSGSAPHFIGYYVLVMGLQGRPWNDCKGKEKDELRKRFDALSTGGHVHMPLGETFFAKAFGMVSDKFGVPWMVIAGQKEVS